MIISCSFWFIDKRKLLKRTAETVKIEVTKQTEELLGKLLVTLVASLLGDMLARKGVLKAGEGKIRTAEDFQYHLIL